ncbi:putative surface-exposed virulence protein BigA [Liparis tanakae]|uniref:Putative surface-exposed virulence protein BigA n=1 Tax=Liparis tanakae TaxID=230148 RepID=A0A4Z2E927_9TELE|nr:putative surface-exposed virulence protein BigA [Liparis tanakae]
MSWALTDSSMQRRTQSWYWSRSGSRSQKILKASHTVSWHTETRVTSMWSQVEVLEVVVDRLLHRLLGAELDSAGKQDAPSPPSHSGVSALKKPSGERRWTGDRQAGPPRRTGDRQAGPPRRTGDRQQGPPRRTGDRQQGPPRRTGDRQAGPPRRTGDRQAGPPRRTGDRQAGLPRRTGPLQACRRSRASAEGKPVLDSTDHSGTFTG